MRTISTLLIITLLGLSLNLSAQVSKITNGVLSYNDKDFGAAVESFNEALADPSGLKDKHKAKGYSYLGRSLAMIYYDATYKNGDKALLEKYPDLAETAYDAFMQAEKFDDRNRYVDENKQPFYTITAEALYLKGFEHYNNNQPEDALNLLNKAVDLVEKNDLNTLYAAFMIRGYTFNRLGKKDKAIADFETALEMYQTALESGKLPQADPNVAGVYENLIVLYSSHLQDLDKTLNIVEEAKKAFPKNEQIVKLELQVYQDNPEFYEKGLEKFEEAVNNNPNDVTLLINYANMLEQGDTTKAIKYYQRAIELEPNNFIANFNLGALHNNIAKQYYDQANESEDAAEIERLNKLKDEQLNLALKHMKKAHEAKPDNAAALQALMNITSFLGQTEEYQKYKAKLDALGQ